MSKEKQIEEMALELCRPRNIVKMIHHRTCGNCDTSSCDIYELCVDLYNAGYRKMPENMGEFSDGYHTFNELYHHRAVLFSVICNMFPEKAWKSKKHDTGDMYEGMFIVGIETEQGQATYHYDIEPYWDIFKVKELEYAPKYDGHTPSDAIARIGNLPCEGYRKQSENTVEVVRCKDCDFFQMVNGRAMCSINAKKEENLWLGLRATVEDGFCHRGAKMKGGGE